MIVMIRHNDNDDKTNLALDWSDRPDVAVDPHVVLVLHQTIWLPDLCLYKCICCSLKLIDCYKKYSNKAFALQRD